MIAAIYLPLWTFGAGIIVLCMLPDVPVALRWLRKRVGGGRG